MHRKKEQYCLYLKRERKKTLPPTRMTNINTITSIALFKNQTSFVLSSLFLTPCIYVAAIHSKSVAQLCLRLLPLILFLVHFLHLHFLHLTFASFLRVNVPTKKQQPNKQTKNHLELCVECANIDSSDSPV